MAGHHRMMSGRRRPGWSLAASQVPAWLLLGLGVLVPLATLVWAARSGVPGSIESTVPVTERLARTVGTTLVQAGASTLATLVVGFPVAWVLARFHFPGKGLVRAVVAMPFVLPSVVVGAAVLALAGPSGPLGSVAPRPGSAESLALVVLAHVAYELIIVVAVVGARLESMPQHLDEAARTLGAGGWRRATGVALPQLAPAFARAAALVFLLTAGSLGVVLVLGGPRWATLDLEVWYLGTQLLDLRGAALLALVQAGFVVVVAGVWLGTSGGAARRGSGRVTRSAPLSAGRAGAPASGLRPPRRPRGAEWWWVAGAVAVVSAFSAAPFVALGTRLGSVSPGRFAELWVEGDRGVAPLGPAVARSLGYATAVALVCTAAAVGLGLAVRRGRGAVASGLVALPVGVSAAAIGLGVVLMALVGPVDLRGSGVAVVLVQAAMALPFAAGVIVPVMLALPDSLEEAAAMLGAGWGQRWRRVLWPLAAVGVAGGAALAAAVALGEFGASTFIVRGDAPTLPTLVGRLLARQAPEAVSLGTLVAALLGVLCAVLVVGADRLAERSRLDR
ncbi:MAG: ABC transporter permease subunit [Microthrixaceae bacterium]